MIRGSRSRVGPRVQDQVAEVLAGAERRRRWRWRRWFFGLRQSAGREQDWRRRLRRRRLRGWRHRLGLGVPAVSRVPDLGGVRRVEVRGRRRFQGCRLGRVRAARGEGPPVFRRCVQGCRLGRVRAARGAGPPAFPRVPTGSGAGAQGRWRVGVGRPACRGCAWRPRPDRRAGPGGAPGARRPQAEHGWGRPGRGDVGASRRSRRSAEEAHAAGEHAVRRLGQIDRPGAGHAGRGERLDRCR